MLKKICIFLCGLIIITACEPAKVSKSKVKKKTETPVVYRSDGVMAGMNTWFLRDWDGSRAFVDVMKHSRPWMDVEAKASLTKAQTDALGWPLTDCSTVVLTNVRPEYDNGTYLLSFEGSAEVSVDWVNSASVSDYTYDAATNISTAKINMNSDGAAWSAPRLVMRKTKLTPSSTEGTGVKNVKLIRPGYDADTKQIFTTEFLNGFSHSTVIRGMETMNINMNTLTTWAERSKPVSATQCLFPPDMTLNLPDTDGSYSEFVLTGSGGSYGIAIEYLVALCNATDNDLWINIPACADDEYIEKSFQLIMYGSDGVNPYTSQVSNPVYPPLEANLRIYVEYANEIWNFGGGFWSFYQIRDILGKLPSSHPVFLQSQMPGGLYQALYTYPAYKLGEVSRMLRSSYGDSLMMTRFRPVLCTQQGDANGTLSLPLNWADAYYRKQLGIELRDLFWGAGGSAYYDVEKNTSNINELLAESNYPDPEFCANNQIDSTLAYNFGLKRVAYEAGFGLDLRDDNWQRLFTEEEQKDIAADERVYDVMMKTHTAWEQTGGDLMMYYCLIGPSSWEMAPSSYEYDTPKMRAFNAINLRKKAKVTMGSPLPGDVQVTDVYPDTEGTHIVRTGWGYYGTGSTGEKVIAGFAAGEWIAVPCHADNAFSGSLTVSGTNGSGSDRTLEIHINGVFTGTVALPSGEGLQVTLPLNVTVPEGLVVIRVTTRDGDYGLYSVMVE